MDTQKSFLESQGWTCGRCACRGKGYDCINNNYKGYMIKLTPLNLAFILFKGRTVASAPLFKLKKILDENITNVQPA